MPNTSLYSLDTELNVWFENYSASFCTTSHSTSIDDGSLELVCSAISDDGGYQTDATVTVNW
jgi:hypothetical protein